MLSKEPVCFFNSRSMSGALAGGNCFADTISLLEEVTAINQERQRNEQGEEFHSTVKKYFLPVYKSPQVSTHLQFPSSPRRFNNTDIFFLGFQLLLVHVKELGNQFHSKDSLLQWLDQNNLRPQKHRLRAISSFIQDSDFDKTLVLSRYWNRRAGPLQYAGDKKGRCLPQSDGCVERQLEEAFA